MSDQQIKNHFTNLMYYKDWKNFCTILGISQILALKYPISWIENNLDIINTCLLKRNSDKGVIIENYYWVLQHFLYKRCIVKNVELEYNLTDKNSLYSIELLNHVEVVNILKRKALNELKKQFEDWYPTIYKITDNSFGESLKLALQYEKEEIKNTK